MEHLRSMHLFLSSLSALLLLSAVHTSAESICIIGSGVGGSSAAHFIRNLSGNAHDIHVFEAHDSVGGRTAVVELSGDFFEAGASIIHSKNLHLVNFADLLGLEKVKAPDTEAGIWNGKEFVFREVSYGDGWMAKRLADLVNTSQLIWRYGVWNLYYMQSCASEALGKWLQLYDKNFPSFEGIPQMLQAVGLYEVTQVRFDEYLLKKGMSAPFINELIAMITRVQYNQNTTLSGLAGAVALVGTGLEGGVGNHTCDAVIIATPLEEAELEIRPPPLEEVPRRVYQTTHVTFVRGFINHTYFGVEESSLPAMIGTLELEAVPFSSISRLRAYAPGDAAYKIFSRAAMSDALLDDIFSCRNLTKRLQWAAYPHYHAPEHFSSFILDANHLYYINTFESAASAMETAAVAAKNVVRLLLSRLQTNSSSEQVRNIGMMPELDLSHSKRQDL
eukprot:jgi/Mesen1/10055/ME000730S09350